MVWRYEDEFGERGFWEAIYTIPFDEPPEVIYSAVEKAKAAADKFYATLARIQVRIPDVIEAPAKIFWVAPGEVLTKLSAALWRIESPSYKAATVVLQAYCRSMQCVAFVSTTGGRLGMYSHEERERVKVYVSIVDEEVQPLLAPDFMPNVSKLEYDVISYLLYLRQRVVSGDGDPEKSDMVSNIEVVTASDDYTKQGN